MLAVTARHRHRFYCSTRLLVHASGSRQPSSTSRLGLVRQLRAPTSPFLLSHLKLCCTLPGLSRLPVKVLARVLVALVAALVLASPACVDAARRHHGIGTAGSASSTTPTVPPPQPSHVSAALQAAVAKRARQERLARRNSKRQKQPVQAASSSS